MYSRIEMSGDFEELWGLELVTSLFCMRLYL